MLQSLKSVVLDLTSLKQENIQNQAKISQMQQERKVEIKKAELSTPGPISPRTSLSGTPPIVLASSSELFYGKNSPQPPPEIFSPFKYSPTSGLHTSSSSTTQVSSNDENALARANSGFSSTKKFFAELGSGPTIAGQEKSPIRDSTSLPTSSSLQNLAQIFDVEFLRKEIVLQNSKLRAMENSLKEKEKKINELTQYKKEVERAKSSSVTITTSTSGPDFPGKFIGSNSSDNSEQNITSNLKTANSENAVKSLRNDNSANSLLPNKRDPKLSKSEVRFFCKIL